ncbi:hypothetical protein RIVERRIDER_29 [Xanthomonas phage RiverRider]|uniref:Uncharacterized protein n=1 Tax=Xanthomonas phage RiverRider TaxID=2108116 RepID=A0A2P1JUT0_9CAUD|nr:hypothetical protein HWB58_gp29 [Xanthomonas phage RiverRider]AVO23117.1 hypothetical protein RIVERRIDER_29 [Xanthomonas phage RiverRider]
MSKTIYLDGTETLIYTRSLIETNYRPNSMVSLSEMEVMECVRTACLYPGQPCIMEFNQPQDPYRRERLATKLLAALDLRNHHHYELYVNHTNMQLLIRHRDSSRSYYQIKAEIPWIKFTP